jgi:hypothetical protein
MDVSSLPLGGWCSIRISLVLVTLQKSVSSQGSFAGYRPALRAVEMATEIAVPQVGQLYNENANSPKPTSATKPCSEAQSLRSSIVLAMKDPNFVTDASSAPSR